MEMGERVVMVEMVEMARIIRKASKPARELRETIMARTKTRPGDGAEQLETAKGRAAYPKAAGEEGDPAPVAAARGDSARVKGISQIARATGLGCGSLYKALSLKENPAFVTVLKVIRAPGLRLRAAAASGWTPFCFHNPGSAAAGHAGNFRGAWHDIDRDPITVQPTVYLFTWASSSVIPKPGLSGMAMIPFLTSGGSVTMSVRSGSAFIFNS